ncbi:alpha-galactosidase-like protein [Haloactinopolyspora alba]|uniref:Alpha-galactosidase-like protein n=1 Tax=Haloactinopolyspora alba TaxID=648780 RepID=A0A2P8DYY9_9ACTN|nr:glycoside hydrolase family 97 catalytic domain-containing protein [Haloactinopolyspora alba]PSL02433.1 alpha-galactosidase-like protein [Haloactinopolyspora alba]
MNRPSSSRAGAVLAGTALTASLLSIPAAASGTEPAPTATTNGTWTVSAPPAAGTTPPTAHVGLDDAGTPTLAVSAGGENVLAPAPIGIVTDGADLSTGLRLVEHSERIVTENYTTTTGKETTRHRVMRAATFSFAGDGGTELDVEVRVATDGVAYRYRLPDRDGTTVVSGEASSWRLPTDAPAWLLPHTAWYEEPRTETTVGTAATDDYGHPALFDVDGTYVLLAESGLKSSYPGAFLTHEQGTGRFGVGLVQSKVTAEDELVTPWRTAIVGDLGTVTESTLVDDLAPDSRVDDTSWIEPGTVAWSWLPEHSSPTDFERQKDYVDYAAEHGYEYTLVDEGWNAAWVPDLVRYARARGVDILLWFRWWEVQTPEEMAEQFSRITSWGVKGVKIDFMNTGAPTHGESTDRHRWYEQVLAATAEHELLVNFHGSTLPKGLQRTWPHLMTYEAVRGAEYYSFGGDPQVTPSYNTMLPFSRNVVGSMDYTPLTFGQQSRSTTDGHELALPVVFESGLLHVAETPEVLAQRPEAERVIDQLPTVWDETSLVAGDPGSHAVLARRSGDRWFVGGIVGGAGRELDVPVDFVRGGRWLVEIVTDDGSGGLVRTSERVVRGDTITVPVQADGGFVAIMCRATDRRQSCDEPVHTAPDSTLRVEPAEAVVEPGTSVTVDAAFTLDEGDPVHDVTMRATAPDGWRVDGPQVRRARLAAGVELTGQWTLTATDTAATGFVDLPVAVEFDHVRGSERERIHVARAVRALVPPPAPDSDAYVSDMEFLTSSNSWGPVERDGSNGETATGDGTTITIGGTEYAKGLGVHATSSVTVYLGGACERFTADVGVDDEVGDQGSVAFRVAGDDATLAETGVLTGADGPRALDVDVSGVQLLTLEVTDGGDGINSDHADWAGAMLHCG